MKFAFMLNARDKAKHVRVAARSILLQESSEPFEVLLSDQGSTDGTREILDEEARTYSGPNTVRRLNCPITEPRGMLGLNVHFDWCMTQTDADVVLQLSADDYTLPTRMEKVRAVFREHGPSMVLCGMYYVGQEMEHLGDGVTPAADGYGKLDEIVSNSLGGSSAHAWTRTFYEKIGGLGYQIGSQDIVMPFLAACDNGCYFITERLHCYRKCIGPENTGLEGIFFHYPEGSKERQQYEELIHFQVIAGLYTVLRVMDKNGWRTPEREQALATALLDRACGWTIAREKLTLAKIHPLPFKV